MSHDAVTLTQQDIDAVIAALQKVTVTPSKRAYVVGRSEAVGWTDFRRAKKVAATSLKENYVHLQLVVNDVITRCFPGFVWTTLMLNVNARSVPHRDVGNVGDSVAIIIMPTTPKEDEGLLVYTDTAAAPSRGTDPSGAAVVGRPGQAVRFSGQREHATTPFDGVRYSIIAFYHKSFARADDAARQQLATLGYQLPETSGMADPSPSRGSDPSGEGGADDDEDADEDIWGDDVPAPDLAIPVTNYTVIRDDIQYKVDGVAEQ